MNTDKTAVTGGRNAARAQFWTKDGLWHILMPCADPNEQGLRRIRVEFVLRDETGKTRNHWQKRFQTEKRAISYFKKLQTDWQGERTASMLILSR